MVEPVTLFSDLAFPAAAFYLMYRFAVVTLERNTIAVGRLAGQLAKERPAENPDWVEEYEEQEPPDVFTWPTRRKRK